MSLRNDAATAGYRGEALLAIERLGLQVFDLVEVTTSRGTFVGLVVPRSQAADDRHIVLRLPSGHNAGIAVASILRAAKLGSRPPVYTAPTAAFPERAGKPNVLLLGTGGNIASRVDFHTGQVVPAFSPEELCCLVPELADICTLSTRTLYNVFSQDMGPREYVGMARAIGEAIAEGRDGIVIGHGTDTLHHTAAVLSFMVRFSPIPIVLVGSQRSVDRPGSDAALNLICATKTAAASDIAEVLVCMFGPTSDEYCLLHRGTRVRKMHASYRSAFRTVGDIPVGMVDPDTIVPLREDYARRRRDRDVILDPVFDDRVTLLYHYPAMKADVVDAVVDRGYRGIVVAGTGAGAVNREVLPGLERAVRRGVHVVMAVQTLWGYAELRGSDTGRRLFELGVVPAANMLPEVAYMKLCWALGHAEATRDEIAEMMLAPVAGEITPREPHDGYLVYQGGIPEVEAFLSKYRR